MSLNQEVKQNLVKKFQKSANDTGSTEVQVALFSSRIDDITGHLKEHKKDIHSRHGLLKLVHKRRKLLKYLKNKDLGRYQVLIKELNLRG